MTSTERRAVVALGSIYALRMLGLFMILPVFALYATNYDGYSPALAGLAIGIYGLSQACLQIPYGMASDRFGRKPVITIGLVIFILGSVLAATSDHILGLVLGRALQGAGAIAAVVMALTADLTADEHRTKAMAGIGASIGLAFGVAMVAGPLIAASTGLAGIFWLTAGLAVAAIGVLHGLVPNAPVRGIRDVRPVRAQLRSVLQHRELWRLDVGIFALHLALTAVFVVLPLSLRDGAGIAAEQHWMVFLGVMVLAIAAMVPWIIVSERRGKVKPVFLGAVACLAVACLWLALATGRWSFLVALVFFFTAFNLLEATLPSLVSRVAPADMKGTALGVYSTAQFSGAFAGGSLGGWIHGSYGDTTVFVLAAGVLAIWFVVALSMQRPPLVARRVFSVGNLTGEEARALAERLRAVAGVREAVVVAEEQLAYLKVDRDGLDESGLNAVRSSP
jgi:MFS family permease